jgi:hypothetical protein
VRGKRLVGGMAALAAGAWSMAGAQGAASGGVPAVSEDQCRLEVRMVGEEEVSIGQSFALEVLGHGPAGAVWGFPAQMDADEVELRVAPVARGEQASPDRQRYAALAFALGEVSVPPIAAECRLADGSRHEVKSRPLKVRLRSLLPKDPAEQKLADIRPPLALSVGAAFWAALASVVGALGGAGTLIVRRWRRAKSAVRMAAEVLVPADVEARRALAELARSGALDRDDLRGHYIALTHVAKRYLERRLGAPVLEMTSAETLACLRRHPHGDRLLGSMRALVGSADQIKFARGLAAREQGERDLRAVGGMIDALEEALRPLSSGASGRGVSG